MGLDEVRRFNVINKAPVPVFADDRTLAELSRTFAYAFDANAPKGGGVPDLRLWRIGGTFLLGRQEVTPVPLVHGPWRILGFRFGRFAYLTDCSGVPESSVALLGGLDTLVLDALRRKPHPTHFTLDQAVAMARRIGARADVLHAHRARPRSCRDLRGAAGGDGPGVRWADLDGQLTSAPMQVLHFPDSPRPKWPSPIAALGNFDGLHRGHLKLLERVRREAGERGGTPVAVIFDPHPPRVLRPDKAPPLLMTLDQKLEGFERAGMQGVAIVRFTHELSRWEPELFVETVLIDWLRAAEVWVGANFLFGRERSGTFTLLRALGEDRGFRTEKIEPVRYKDFVVSSTRDSASGRRGPRRRSGRAARPSLLRRRHGGHRRRPRPRRSGFPPPIWPRPTSCCRRSASTRRLPSSAGSSIAR